MKTENEQVDVLNGPSEKNDDAFHLSNLKEDTWTNDLHIVSRQNWENAKKKYFSLVEKHEHLQKKYIELEEINRNQKIQIEKLQNEDFQGKKSHKRRKYK